MKRLDYGKGYQYAHDEPDASRRHGLPAAGARAAGSYYAADRARLREGNQAAAGRLGEASSGQSEVGPLERFER